MVTLDTPATPPTEAKTPNDAAALGQMAVMLTTHSAFEKGGYDVSGAVRLAQKAVDLRPEDPYLLDLAAGIYFQSGDVRTALSYQQKALSVLDRSEMRGNKDFQAILEQHLALYRAKAK